MKRRNVFLAIAGVFGLTGLLKASQPERKPYGWRMKSTFKCVDGENVTFNYGTVFEDDGPTNAFYPIVNGAYQSPIYLSASEYVKARKKQLLDGGIPFGSLNIMSCEINGVIKQVDYSKVVDLELTPFYRD